jgi:hypothetical protein
MFDRSQPKLLNVVAYAAFASIGFGYILFLCGPSKSDAVAAWALWLVMLNAANVALHWQSLKQPMRLPTRAEVKAILALRLDAILRGMTVLCWAGAVVFFLSALPKETWRPEFLISNKPLWAFLWGGMVMLQVCRLMSRAIAAPLTEQANAADSR